MSEAKIHQEMVDVKPGVYFGMSEERYHKNNALGSTDLRELLVAPQNWHWNRADNPLKEFEPDTSAMRFGRAVHALVLEGQQAFESRFIKKPQLPPGCLITQEQLKNHCKKLNLKITGTKADLAERIREVDNHTALEPEIMAKFEAEKGDKTLLNDNDYARILMASHNITQNPHLASAFSGGMPEVSVFWYQNGVPVKARIDYLRPHECIDLKSTSNWRNESMDEAWIRTIRTSRYDMQAAHYMRGRDMVAEFIAEDMVFVEDSTYPGQDWLAEVAMANDISWLWVVYQTEGAPIAQGYRAPLGTALMDRAAADVEVALENWHINTVEFGEGEWLNTRRIVTLTDEDMPPWWVSRRMPT